MKRLFKVGVILTGLVISGHTNTWGGDWKLFDSNDKEIRYYYVQNEKKRHDIIGMPSDVHLRVWVKVEYTEKGLPDMVQQRGKKYENFMYTMMEQELDCPYKKWRNLSTYYFSKEGKIIDSSLVVGGWKKIKPDSMAAALCKAVYKEP